MNSYPFYLSLSPEKQAMIVRPEHKLPPEVVAEVSKKPVAVLTEGLGANLPRIDQPGQEQAYPQNEEDWQKLEHHLDWLGLSWIRYWLFGEKVIPEPGAFHPEHDYMQRLLRLHEWAEPRDAHLILDFGVTPTWLKFATDDARSFRLSAPNDIEQYVEAYALPLLKYILQERGLDQIKYLSLFNEPFCPDHNGFSFYVPEGIDVFEHYLKLFSLMRRRLDEEGFPELGMIGPNSHDLYLKPLEEMKRRGLDLYPYIAAVDEHCYRTRFDYLPPVRHMPTQTIGYTMEYYLKPSLRDAQAHGKPYFLTEYSTFYYGGITGDRKGSSRHDAVINEVELAVRSLAEGVNGAMKWSFINGGLFDGLWQYIETMDGSYKPVPAVYYANAVLTRFTPRGSAIHPITFRGHKTDCLHGIGLRQDDDVTVLLINDHPAEQAKISMAREVFGAGRKLTARITDEVRKYETMELEEGDSAVACLLHPMSITAITTLDIGDGENGAL